MVQVLINLNAAEQQQLEQWLDKKYPDCRLRSLYDHFISSNQKELCAVEGPICQNMYVDLEQQYSGQLKSGLRFV